MPPEGRRHRLGLCALGWRWPARYWISAKGYTVGAVRLHSDQWHRGNSASQACELKDPPGAS
jgi:hypothetical protein